MSKKSNIRMTKIVLSISLIILLGRLVYSAIGAYSHHQNQRQTDTHTQVSAEDTAKTKFTPAP